MSNICWRLYPEQLGDVWLGHLNQPLFLTRSTSLLIHTYPTFNGSEVSYSCNRTCVVVDLIPAASGPSHRKTAPGVRVPGTHILPVLLGLEKRGLGDEMWLK